MEESSQDGRSIFISVGSGVNCSTNADNGASQENVATEKEKKTRPRKPRGRTLGEGRSKRQASPSHGRGRDGH